MKKLLCLCLGLYLNHAAAAPHLELVKKHISDFINMALITQLFPLNDGGYIVQRYGHLVARYDSNSELIKEIDLGTDNYIYQKGMQLKDGRIVFIDDSSMISFYDMDLNKISQVYVPREYLWAPCEINNGKLVFGTYNEELMVVMNNEGKLTEIGNLGNHLRKTFCVDNQAMVMSENGTLSIVDLEQDEPKLIYQKDFNYINKSISLKNQKLNFLTYEGLNIVDPKTFIEGFWPNDQIRQYDGVEYFSDGRYVLINTVRNDQGNYDSKLQVYSKEGMVLGSAIQKKSGGTLESQILIINDRYILTNHCSSDLVLYEMGNELLEIDRITTKKLFCREGISIDSENFVFEARGQNELEIYHLRLAN